MVLLTTAKLSVELDGTVVFVSGFEGKMILLGDVLD